MLTSLEKINRLAVATNDQKAAITGALDDLPEALRVVNGQRDDLVKLLQSLSRLSDVATGVIRDSKADTVANLRALVPTLTNLTKAGDDLAYATKALLTYPFSDGFVGNTYAKASGKCEDGPPAVKQGVCFGDFSNLSLGLDIGVNQLQTILDGYSASAGVTAPDLPKIIEDPAQGLVGPGHRSRAHRSRPVSPADDRWTDRAAATQPTPTATTTPSPGGICSLLGTCRTAVANTPAGDLRTTSRGTGGGTMISRLTKIQLVIFAIVTVLGGAFVGGRYAQIDRLVVDRSFPVSAQFKDSGGIFAGAQVTYRGIPVGKVGKLSFKDDGVRATLDIENSAPNIPSDVLAVVANKSAIGEQFVDLQPRTNSGPYLHKGSSIALARTPASRSTPRRCWSTSTTWSRRSTPTASAPSSTSWARRSRARVRTCRRSSTPRRSSSRPPTTTST